MDDPQAEIISTLVTPNFQLLNGIQKALWAAASPADRRRALLSLRRQRLRARLSDRPSARHLGRLLGHAVAGMSRIRAR